MQSLLARRLQRLQRGHAPATAELFPEPARRDDSPGEDDSRRELRTVWISDLHLGTRGCKAAMLLDFLEHVRCDRLYLVGDVVDGWSLKKSWYWDEVHNRILERILALSSEGTRVTYVCGNHDEFLRRYLGLRLGDVRLVNEAVHVLRDGRRLLVLHGDAFDVVIRHSRWLADLGSSAYQLTLRFNTLFNRVRALLGYPYWSISAFLKGAVKNAVSYVASFEAAVLREAERRGFDGVVCGHIHKAELYETNGILYCNDGDWVESCTALVETPSGELEILRWADEIESRAHVRALATRTSVAV
jgi:UDP-2,3-diacylglucosamine pyrophosphatase LpxH